MRPAASSADPSGSTPAKRSDSVIANAPSMTEFAKKSTFSDDGRQRVAARFPSSALVVELARQRQRERHREQPHDPHRDEHLAWTQREREPRADAQRERRAERADRAIQSDASAGRRPSPIAYAIVVTFSTRVRHAPHEARDEQRGEAAKSPYASVESAAPSAADAVSVRMPKRRLRRRPSRSRGCGRCD